MQRIVPNIWCNRTAREAGEYYSEVFPNTQTSIESHYPMEGLLDFQSDFAGEPLTVAVDIDGYRLTLINAGDEFRPNPSISFILNFDPLAYGWSIHADKATADDATSQARAALDDIWTKLSDQGTVLMPLGEYPFSARYGWVEDRYGVTWQLMQTDPTGDPRPFVIPSLMYAGPVQNHAGEAVNHYLDTFTKVVDVELGQFATYEQRVGAADPGALQFGDFQLGDDWIAAMDSAVEQSFTFTSGISFEVHCTDQQMIDTLWEALSAKPEWEQCGWLADRFGVSWQIVPENIGELLERPGAWERMMNMKKLVIADF